MPHAYVNLTDMKAHLDISDISDTSDDARLRSCIESASVALDIAFNRRFQPYTATRYYTAKASRALKVDDLLSVTTLKTLTTNANGTRTYGDTWSTTDYDLWPYDAPDDREPYTQIEVNPGGLYTFPTNALGVEVSGVWGYHLDTLSVATTAEALDTSETGVDVSSGASFKTLQTVLIDAEQMYITSISNNTLTVERAINGTTAAAHNTAETVYVYRYPGPVVEACVILATRLFRRKDAPFGVIGSAEFGLERIAANDPDVKRLMMPFARYLMAAV